MEMALINPNSSSIDFQSSDEAWYTISLVLEGETLIVKFCNFSDEHDKRFHAVDFKKSKELEDFSKRFRLSSVQLKDSECNNVVKGMTVCASCGFGMGGVRFYDAVVVEVNHKDHKVVKGEACTCTFVLYWLCGPNSSNITDAVVTQIFLLQSGDAEIDQTLTLFLEICRQKLNGTNDSIIDNMSKSPQLEFHACSPKETKLYNHSVSTPRESKGRSMDHWEKTGQASDFQCVLIENLEKDLSPVTIVDFVKKHVAITSQAQVFPSSSLESYTRGVIVAGSQAEHKRLYDFLTNPAHMILSSRGRPWVTSEKKSDFLDNPAHMFLSSRGKPWVITEKKLKRGAGGGTILSKSLPWDKSLEISDKVRIVSSGTLEYERGKELKKLFLEFVDHQRSLHQRFAMAEGKILVSSNVP